MPARGGRGETWPESTKRLGQFSYFRRVFDQLYQRPQQWNLKKGCFPKSSSEKGLWKYNLTLFVGLNGIFGEILHQKWQVNTGNLKSSGKVVERGETLMQWLSLLLDFGQFPPPWVPCQTLLMKKVSFPKNVCHRCKRFPFPWSWGHNFKCCKTEC